MEFVENIFVELIKQNEQKQENNSKIERRRKKLCLQSTKGL